MVKSNNPKDLKAKSIFCETYDGMAILDSNTAQLNGNKEFSKELLSLIQKHSMAPFGPEELVFEFMVPVSLKNFIPLFVYGKKYEVSFHRIQKEMSSKDCIEFLKNKNSILAGKQGIAFLKKMNLFFKFPKGLVVFFGEEDGEDDDRIVSYIQNRGYSVEEAKGASKMAWPTSAFLVSFKEV